MNLWFYVVAAWIAPVAIAVLWFHAKFLEKPKAEVRDSREQLLVTNASTRLRPVSQLTFSQFKGSRAVWGNVQSTRNPLRFAGSHRQADDLVRDVDLVTVEARQTVDLQRLVYATLANLQFEQSSQHAHLALSGRSGASGVQSEAERIERLAKWWDLTQGREQAVQNPAEADAL